MMHGPYNFTNVDLPVVAVKPQLGVPLRAQVDLIDMVGPLYSGFDNRVAALRLVQKGLCDAALFDPSGARLALSQ